MSWSNSKIFSAFMHDCLGAQATRNIDIDTDASVLVALYNDSLTPSQIVTSANSCYAAGVWTSGSSPNLQDTTSGNAGWPYAGRPLAWGSATRFSTYADTTVKFDADDTASADSHTTIASAYGCLVYSGTSTTPADQGISYHYFGGAQSVTEGTMTIVWHASGIFSIAL